MQLGSLTVDSSTCAKRHPVLCGLQCLFDIFYGWQCGAGNACITDTGVASLAEAPAVLQQLQELVLDAVQCTLEGIQMLLKRCTGLRKLELFGLLTSALAL